MTLPAPPASLLRHWAVQGAAITFAGLAVEYATQFGRSMVLTHQLDRTQFGIASAMAATLTLVDMSTGLGADRYLVQARAGGSETALAVAHTLTVCRGFLSGGLLVVLALPTSRLLGIGGYAIDFACLAIIPIIRAFEHLRLAQLQRQHLFCRSALATSFANAIGLAAVLIVSALTHDCRAVPLGMGAHALALVAASHLAARCRYRLAFSPQALEQALRFGLPLMINGLALAAVAQCDRLAVGHFLGVTALGHYTVAAMTFYLPTSLLLRLLMSVAQPRLSAAWHASPAGDFPSVFDRLNRMVAATAAGFSLGVMLCGNLVLQTLFGAGFVVSNSFLFIYGLFVFLRFAKTSINFGGLAMGRTKDLMVSNLPGFATLLLSSAALSTWPYLVSVACTSLLGEVAGIALACDRLRADLDAGRFCLSFAIAMPLPVLSGLLMILAHPASWMRVAACAAALIILVVLAATTRPAGRIQRITAALQKPTFAGSHIK